MAHEITATDNMVSANNVVPWHNLGVRLPGMITAADALKHAGLAWEVVHEPIFDGDMVKVECAKLNRRSDTREVLGVVPKDWTAVQNTALIEIAEALGQADGEFDKPVIETAGSLRGGRIVWALVKLSERQFAGSDHRTYLLLSNGHDGRRAVRGTLTDVRVVCANTLGAAEATSSQLYVTHTKGVLERMNTAVRLLGWTNNATAATFALYTKLAATPMSVDDVAKRATELFPATHRNPANTAEFRAMNEKIANMVDLFRTGAGNEGRTAFDFVNAITDYVDHVRPMRDDDTIAARRFEFATMGQGAAMKTKALAIARQFAVA